MPSACLTGRLKTGEPLKAEAVGIVFLTAGLSLLLEVSFLSSGMVAGAVVGNLAHHHDRAFHEIENNQWPFIILFFLLAGATLDNEAFGFMGWAGALFLILRAVARLVGGLLRSNPTPRMIPSLSSADFSCLRRCDAEPGQAITLTNYYYHPSGGPRCSCPL